MGWGFLDSIFHGAQTIIQNAGAIGDAIAAIKKVASAVTGSVVSPDNFLDDLDSILETAAHVLSTAAQFPPAELKKSDDPSTTTVQKTFAGLWTVPTTLTADGNITQQMYDDLSKNLNYQGVPSSFNDGTKVDPIQAVGQKAFANAPTSPLDVAEGAPPYSVVGPFTITNKDHSVVLTGKHAYYTIPMASEGSKTMWHSALNMAITTTESFRDAYKKLPGTQVKINPAARKAGDAPAWLVSLDVTWSSAPYAIDVWPTFQNLWTQKYGPTSSTPESITYFGPESNTWHIKIQAAPGVTPAQVRGQVGGVAVDAIAARPLSPSPFARKAGSLDDSQTIQQPVVEVTEASLQL
jgi:hypothetical protein